LKDQTQIFQLQARVPSWATMLSCDAVPKMLRTAVILRGALGNR